MSPGTMSPWCTRMISAVLTSAPGARRPPQLLRRRRRLLRSGPALSSLAVNATAARERHVAVQLHGASARKPRARAPGRLPSCLLTIHRGAGRSVARRYIEGRRQRGRRTYKQAAMHSTITQHKTNHTLRWPPFLVILDTYVTVVAARARVN